MSTSGLAWFKSSHSGSQGDNCVEISFSWRKSTYSSGGDGDCVEVAVSWHKSSHSGDSGDACVEVAACPEVIHVRDSKDKDGPHLTFAPTAWSEFLTLARDL
ncbi:DUF397 domain-containing protein [Streptomyces sp. PTM05]|uniref:DUF397 domain-containing protein n=1 Tax=Streptantibioticus parmotrematis TaxID=2873249 RepID=A0ABS7QZI3_9ACTN|nr:DUF397 domain-containing protein [Streptantibioticus parmotrematis]MBY8888628.1 DUF397 domain-containing protein [Streptantibioticus parmotrematis]